MKVLILTEGGCGIGFGHMARCQSLYQAFKIRKTTTQFIINADTAARNFFKNKDAIFLNWIKERAQLFKYIEKADMVIIDSYLADLALYKKISSRVKKLVCIDDTVRLDYPCKVIVNGAVFAQNLNYRQKKGITFLLGSKYTPLRKEFWKVSNKKIRARIKNILIMLGGTDIANLLKGAMGMLNKKYPLYQKKIIVGCGFKNTRFLDQLSDMHCRVIYNPDAKAIKREMLASDVAISAGGQTLYELARVGVPTVAIRVAANQSNNLKGLRKAGFIEYAASATNSKLFNTIGKCLDTIKDQRIRETMSRKGRALVDGAGALRIVDYLLN
ncbi:MAG: UDP-2,4-diacetamido-2,4,6-trideoxy-beta-L-altropyranose hydrolase [Candidatus Omnitrophica bacterium]|nr:UDP-2,4-diacetamido-2,4,6-trideoxy-beta-L-altropyranose hydrolase [Candidatus Omnitrophota bacterium]